MLPNLDLNVYIGEKGWPFIEDKTFVRADPDVVEISTEKLLDSTGLRQFYHRNDTNTPPKYKEDGDEPPDLFSGN